MGFSRQEYWSGVPLPSPGDLPDPGIEPGSPALQADAEGNLVTIKEPLPVPLPPSSRKTLKVRIFTGPGKIVRTIQL